MNYKLRRRHQLIWILWAVLIPMGLFAAYSVLPQQKIPIESKALYPDESTPTFELLSEKKEEDMTWRLWKSSDSTYQVEASLQRALKAPAAFVYVVPTLEAPLSSGEVLGKLGPVGNYSFSLDSSWISSEGICLVLRDPLHGETLQTLELVP